jgi:parallel beta helix pectate lyase-like protein
VTSGRGQERRRRLPRPPIALASALAALAAFGAFYAIGRATAGTSSGVRRATPLVLHRARPHVPLLGRAVALPAPPPARHRATHPVAVPPPAPPPPPPKVVPTPAPPPKPPAAAQIVSGSSVGGSGAVPPNLGCARWASSNGSDTAEGSRSAPFRTVSRLGLALRPGQTGCLVAGSTFVENVKLWRAGARGRPIKIRTEGTPDAVIRGSVGISWRAHDLVLAAVHVDGADPRAKAAVTVHGDRVSLVQDEVTGTGFVNRRTPCVDLNYANAAVLDGDQIHTCAVVTRPGSSAPGIVVRHAKGVVIRNSTVYGVPGNGIALGPGATRTLVKHDVLDGNTSGVLIRGAGNVVRNTIVSNSRRYNVHSGRPLGGGNVVAGDCLWSAHGALAKGPGIHFVDNVTADPRYASRPHGVGSGPCYGKRPRETTTNLGTRWPRLHGITVHYRLHVRRGRVQFEELSFAGLDPRSRVVVTCRNGCLASDVLPVSAVGTGDASELTGLWIPKGATIKVRAHRTGWVGAYLRVLLTGAPHGVVVSRACLSPRTGDPVRCRRYEGGR